jgi:glycosyl transferase family 25
MPPAILMINLARSQERLLRSTRQLDALGLTFTRVDAVDGRALPPAEKPARLSPGEWGCLLSHRRAWERIAPAAQGAVVVEDDCALGVPFLRVILSAQRFPRSAELVLLGHHSSRRGPVQGAYGGMFGLRLDGGTCVARAAEFPMGAYAYFVTPAGARKLLRSADHAPMPADWVTGYSPLAGVGLFLVSPPCVVPDVEQAASTTIDDRARAAPAPARTDLLRRWLGPPWLWLRRLGLFPYAYARHPAFLRGRHAAR